MEVSKATRTETISTCHAHFSTLLGLNVKDNQPIPWYGKVIPEIGIFTAVFTSDRLDEAIARIKTKRAPGQTV